jgi:AcrR family transcriptional regulator
MDSKDKILHVAFSLFIHKGYRDVSLREIVDEVGLTKGAFYHYFKGKEQLFTEVVDHFFLGMSDAIYEQLPKTHLKTFMTKYVEKLLEQIYHISKDALKKGDTLPLSYYYLAFDALRILPDFDTKIHEVFHREEKAWIEVIDQAKASGEIVRSIDSRHLAILFISAIDGLGMHLILENRLNQLSEEIISVWTSLYKLIKA